MGLEALQSASLHNLEGGSHQEDLALVYVSFKLLALGTLIKVFF